MDNDSNDKINPAHYKCGFPRKPVECIEVAEHLPFCLGNAIKYIWRAGKKEGEDFLTWTGRTGFVPLRPTRRFLRT